MDVQSLTERALHGQGCMDEAGARPALGKTVKEGCTAGLRGCLAAQEQQSLLPLSVSLPRPCLAAGYTVGWGTTQFLPSGLSFLLSGDEGQKMQVWG